MFILSHYICIFFPSQTKHSTRISRRARRLEEAKRFFNLLNGGTTTRITYRSPADGGYNMNGKIVEERIDEIYSWTDVLSARKKQVVFRYARRLRKELEQESVAILIDGVLHLVV